MKEIAVYEAPIEGEILDAPSDISSDMYDSLLFSLLTPAKRGGLKYDNSRLVEGEVINVKNKH